MKQAGFTKTLKSLKKGHLPSTDLMTVHGGVVEETMFGEYDAALDTDKGRVVLRSAQRTDRSADPQLVTSIIRQDDEATSDAESQNWTSDELLAALSGSSGKILPSMVCAIELTGFDHAQTKILLPLLWQYIVEHRDSNDRDELIAVGAAIRKYIAIMPMDQLGSLSVLLESGHRTPLPMELEIEIAKMVLRNCEVCPPAVANRFPQLSQRFWELVQAYINPRVLLPDKHAAVTSLAIEAIVE